MSIKVLSRSIDIFFYYAQVSINQLQSCLSACRSHILIWDQIDHTHCKKMERGKEVVKGEIFALNAKFRGGNQRRSPFLSFKHRSSFKNLLRVYPNIIIMMIMFVQSNAADQQQQQQQKDCLSVCLSKLLFFLHKVDFDFDKYEMHFLLMPKHIFFFFFLYWHALVKGK